MMGRWAGETLTLPIGVQWTCKLRLEDQTSGESSLVFGKKLFDTIQEAKAAGDAQLETEINKRSKRPQVRRAGKYG
jgi:hypothetical protein